MENVPVEKIKVGKRFRKDFSHVQALAESIRTHGILHPLVVTEDYVLVSGECRLRAAKEIGLKTVPCVLKSSLSEIEAREIELEENVRRKQLHWTEEVALLESLYSLRKEKDPAYSKQDLARDKGESLSSVSKKLTLGKEVKRNPLFKAAVSDMGISEAHSLLLQKGGVKGELFLYPSFDEVTLEEVDVFITTEKREVPFRHKNLIRIGTVGEKITCGKCLVWDRQLTKRGKKKVWNSWLPVFWHGNMTRAMSDVIRIKEPRRLIELFLRSTQAETVFVFDPLTHVFRDGEIAKICSQNGRTTFAVVNDLNYARREI